MTNQEIYKEMKEIDNKIIKLQKISQKIFRKNIIFALRAESYQLLASK